MLHDPELWSVILAASRERDGFISPLGHTKWRLQMAMRRNCRRRRMPFTRNMRALCTSLQSSTVQYSALGEGRAHPKPRWRAPFGALAFPPVVYGKIAELELICALLLSACRATKQNRYWDGPPQYVPNYDKWVAHQDP